MGGILIGLAALILLFFNGKIMGASGISKGIISEDCPDPQERKWRILFVTGMIFGGFLISFLLPEMTAKTSSFSPGKMIIAGLLVGFGTAMGNGCTSGHGVCGLGRRSFRSLVATITFMASGFTTVFILFHVL